VKRLVLCAAALLFCGVMLRAQDEQPINPEMQRQELVNLESENARAIKLHNSTFFKAAYSEDFHGVTRYGETVNKQGIIHELETMNLQFDSVVSSDAQVRMFRDAAFVLSLRSEVGRADGKKFYNQFRVLRVYVNTPRGWRIVSQLETKLATDANR
jgi:ketosteroid isomerase-like protein